MATDNPMRTRMHSSHTSKPVSPAIKITQRKKNASRLLATWEQAALQRGGMTSLKSQHPKSRTRGQHYANISTSNGLAHPHLQFRTSLLYTTSYLWCSLKYTSLYWEKKISVFTTFLSSCSAFFYIFHSSNA